MFRVEIISLAKKEFKLLETLELTINQVGDKAIIPEGFITDLASIPSFLFWLQWGAWNKAAIIHDYLYVHHFISIKTVFYTKKYHLNRKQTDILFYEILLHDGVHPLLAKLMYYAVRLFGGRHWRLVTAAHQLT